MKNYYSIAEIAKELNISQVTLRTRADELGIDTKKIDITHKQQLIDSVIGLKYSKVQEKKGIVDLKNIKVDKSKLLSTKSVSNIEQMRENAIETYNNYQESILRCDEVIKSEGELIDNANGSRSPHPILKIKNEAVKQQTTLLSKIKELEEALKLIATTSDSKSPIDD